MAGTIFEGVPPRLYLGRTIVFQLEYPDFVVGPSEFLQIAIAPLAGGSAWGSNGAHLGNGIYNFTYPGIVAEPVAGECRWLTNLIDATSKKYQIEEGRLELLPTAAAADARTFWEIERDAIKAALTADPNKLVSSYSHNARSLSKYSREELYARLDHAEEMIRIEADELALAEGRTPSRRPTIRMEFN